MVRACLASSQMPVRPTPIGATPLESIKLSFNLLHLFQTKPQASDDCTLYIRGNHAKAGILSHGAIDCFRLKPFACHK